ncbi:uncharacterized protein LOC121997201 [Zingiber officinale]|uniref:uncharacterized protein LOC121997201 n=1 Tax=Zingiber officinale TaxID=94328 RepID=UPI001C4B643B|nr:uncharacterized protein LOC121997201 [Zingiber officinale]
MLYDQRMDKKIVSSDISLMKSNPSTFKPGLGSEFLSEEPKKRKGTDTFPDYKIQNIVSHSGQLNDIYGHVPCTHANLPLPAITPPLVAPKGFPFNSEFVSSRPAYAQFHSRSHPIHSLTTNTFASLVSDSYDSRSSADVIPNWVESSDTNSYTGKNSGHFSPCVNSTNQCVADQESCTTTVETHKMAMVNNYFDSNGKVVAKDFKGGLLEGNYCGQYTDITDETSGKRRKLSIEEPTSSNIGKINHGSHPNLKNRIAHSRHLLDISDERQNQKVVNHLLKPSECEKTWLSSEKSKKSVDFQDEIRVSEVTTDSKHEDENHTLDSQKSIVELSDGLASNNSDELKSVDGKISSVSTEKLWDGSLQLNNSTTVSAVAFFKSGEKAQDIKWSDLIEIKGKVRLHAFEKFIQELPRSRTRALMVISLCWKTGSSLSGLKGMEEIANDYKESKRVGFAQICPGIDLYVCPRSDTIITILAKFGFFKGMNAVVEVPNSLIGCVVWRRGCQTSTSTIKALDRKLTSLVQKQPHSSEEISTNDGSDKQNGNSKQAPLSATEADGMPLHYLSEVKYSNIDIASHTSTKNKLDDSGVELSNSLKTTSNGQIAATLPYNSPIAPVQISPQNVEMMPKGSLRNPLLHAAEAKSVPDSEPVRQVPMQPTQVITENHQRNTICDENLNALSSFLDHFIQSTAPIPPLQPQTAQRPCTSSRENLMETVSKPERCMMHIKGSNNPATRPTMTQTTLLGSASLPSDLSERIIQSTSSVTKETNVGFSSSEIPSEFVSEPRKSSLGNESSYVPPGPPLLPLPGPRPLALGPPQSLTQAPNVSASSVDVDDLPEFDFSSACAGLDKPVNRFSWFTNCNSDAVPFTKQSPRDLGKTPTLLGSTTMQSVEVIQKRQLATFPDNMIKNYQGSPIETNLQKPILDNKVVMKSSLSHGQLCSHAHNSSVGSISNSIFSRRHRWDESDDDMPEWYPPDQVQVDQTQTTATINLPSPVNNWKSEFSRHRPLIASPSPTSLGSPRGPILPHSHLSGSRPPSSLSHDPVAPLHSRATLGFNHSIQRSPLAQNATILSSYQTSTSDKGATNTTPWFRNTRL